MNNYETLSICADDFGISKGVNEAILSLIDNEILSEVSCLIFLLNENKEHFLKLYENNILLSIGLHLFFSNSQKTEFKNLYNYKSIFNEIFFKSHLNLINKKLLEKSINSQLDTFEKFFNFSPVFIDSHMYIHQFPVIANILIKILKSRYQSYPPWVRNSFINLKINTLLMTHPGKNDNYSKAFDDIYYFREKEYLFLKSNKFKEFLSKEKIKIVSLNNILNK